MLLVRIRSQKPFFSAELSNAESSNDVKIIFNNYLPKVENSTIRGLPNDMSIVE
jgi:hypothetical protein